ncbi:MAG TPA: tetratricopeptide repeat protein, partial [Thermodesulfobacteriota bacterium]|nr:tetratricopeptide repeat protein [Thermodesulfobacteriota bacterium]
MKFSLKSRTSLYSSILLAILVPLLLIWNSAQSWLSYVYAGDPPPGGFKEAIEVEDDNSQLYFLLAQFYENYDFTTPRSDIYSLYKKSLELNPLNYNYWYYLAEFLSTEGKSDLALFSLDQATELAPGVVSLRWAAGILASRLGDEETLKSNLHAVIQFDPDRRKKAFIVLWQSLRNGDKILPVIPVTAYEDYVNFLLDTGRLKEAQIVWDNAPNAGQISWSTFLRYVSILIDNDVIGSAKKAWTDKFGAWEGIWNGSFEKGLTNSGFDWTFNNAEGAKIALEENNKDRGNTVRVEFDGTSNIDFYNFRQNVPVAGNTEYELSAWMKSSELPSRNGVFWEAYCPRSKELYAKSEEVHGTTDWHRVSVTFE